MHVSDALIQEKASRLCPDILWEAPTRYAQNFSAGMLDGSKKYYGFRHYKFNGESEAADTLAAEAALAQLCELGSQYGESNVFKADEFAFNYRLPP